MTKLRREFLEFAAKSGWAATYTATVYVVTPGTVYAACKRHGITLIKGKPGCKRGTQRPKDLIREAVIMQSVNEAWTLQELGDKLRITREGARVLLKTRGLNKVRVHHPSFLHVEPKEKPIRRCRECDQIILDTRRWRFCSEGCSESWQRRYHAQQKKARYHADPAFRERQAKWQRDNPDKTAAMKKRYRETVGGQLHYEAMMEKHKRAYAAEPKKKMQCLDCGNLLERKPTVIRTSQRKGHRAPLCKDCRRDAGLAGRRLSHAS